MKQKLGILISGLLCVSAMAQVDTNAPPPIPALEAPATTPVAPAAVAPPSETPATNKPAAKRTKPRKAAPRKTPAKKPAAEAKLLPPLMTNAPAIAKEDYINVRGQATINSEVVGHLKKGEKVTVLEEVTLKHPDVDEPAQWARISLPPDADVWVSKLFLDANNTVTPAKLNVRSGPGENYSVLGMVHKGDAVKVISDKGEWKRIEPPADSYAFVAAHLLSQEEAAPAPVKPTPPPTEPVTPPAQPATSVVSAPAPIAPGPVDAPATPTSTPPPTPIVTPPVAEPVTPAPAEPAPAVVVPPVPAPLPPPAEPETPAKRIITREGIVRGAVSIRTPTHFTLESLDNGSVINYLYSPSTNIVMKRYRGHTVLVTGEEGLDERWPNIPVITIQKIEVVQ